MILQYGAPCASSQHNAGVSHTFSLLKYPDFIGIFDKGHAFANRSEFFRFGGMNTLPTGFLPFQNLGVDILLPHLRNIFNRGTAVGQIKPR